MVCSPAREPQGLRHFIMIAVPPLTQRATTVLFPKRGTDRGTPMTADDEQSKGCVAAPPPPRLRARCLNLRYLHVEGTVRRGEAEVGREAEGARHHGARRRLTGSSAARTKTDERIPCIGSRRAAAD